MGLLTLCVSNTVHCYAGYRILTMEIALMIEGQDGLTWPRWQRLAAAAEELGFVGLYRSDHYTNANPPDKESLELWVSLTWLAGHTQRLEFAVPAAGSARRCKCESYMTEMEAIDAIKTRLGQRSIVLVGLMGCGKSSIGKRLATRLGLPFLDADEEIERAAAKTINEIFSDHGEVHFRFYWV